ncbi:hypothetical protein [Mycobacterium colombiense]|nr:hypothetical protein [Mycobacterium colombiense]
MRAEVGSGKVADPVHIPARTACRAEGARAFVQVDRRPSVVFRFVTPL